MIDPVLARIPELDRLIDQKLEAIADCIGRQRDMGEFKGLPDPEQESLLDDAFEQVEAWEAALPAARARLAQGELQRLLQEHHVLTQQMKAIHREVDRLVRGSN